MLIKKLMINPKIIFIGTGQFAQPILKKLIQNDYNIIKQIDRPVALQPAEIKKLAPDLIIVAGYGKIIKKEILKIPQFGVLNIHGSLLPVYRGPSPIQTAILQGDKKTGATIIIMDEAIDHGPIVGQKPMEIDSQDNYQTLSEKLANLSADLLIEILPAYLQGKIQPRKQSESEATYTKILTRQDGRIDWQQSARQIARQVRAFYPWPGAWTEFKGLRVKILKAKVVQEKQAAALPTQQGFLFLELVQPAGKKPMTGQAFFRGHPLISSLPINQ